MMGEAADIAELRSELRALKRDLSDREMAMTIRTGDMYAANLVATMQLISLLILNKVATPEEVAEAFQIASDDIMKGRGGEYGIRAMESIIAHVAPFRKTPPAPSN